MKPVPPGFCYAADNAVIPGRPWWHVAPRRGLTDPGAGMAARPGFDRSGGAHAATVEDAERIDREYPLPHPGYRAGQVWLVDVPEPEWRQSLPAGAPLERPHVRFRQHTIDRMHGDIPVLGDGRPADHALCRGAAFLLFDPLMPHLAPWGPKE